MTFEPKPRVLERSLASVIGHSDLMPPRLSVFDTWRGGLAALENCPNDIPIGLDGRGKPKLGGRLHVQAYEIARKPTTISAFSISLIFY